MPGPFQFPFLWGIPVLPARRVAVVDAGSHSIKLLLAESLLGRMRILQHRTVNLQKEGLLSPLEIAAHLETLLQEWSHTGFAVLLSRDRAVSHLANGRDRVRPIPAGQGATVRGRVELRFDDGAVAWIVQATRGDIDQRLEQLALPANDTLLVTDPANALIAAAQFLPKRFTKNSVLIDLGAEGTTLVWLTDGHGAAAAQITIGGDHFTEALARATGMSFQDAEAARREASLAKLHPALQAALEEWIQAVCRILSQWEQSDGNPAGTWRILLCGGVTRQAGIIDFLNYQDFAAFHHWPQEGSGWRIPDARFVVAHGAALQALAKSGRAAALVPQDFRERQDRRAVLRTLHTACFWFAMIIAGMLALGIGKTRREIVAQEDALERTGSVLESSARLARQYETIRPTLWRARQTEQTLQMLDAFWAAGKTNSESAWLTALADIQSWQEHTRSSATNALPERPLVRPTQGWIAEATWIGPGNQSLDRATALLDRLKALGRFKTADLLMNREDKPLAATNVVVAQNRFMLKLAPLPNPFDKPKVVELPSGTKTWSSPTP